MEGNKSSISQAESYEEIGDYWDERDLAEHWDKTAPVEFAVTLNSETTYYPIETALSTRLHSIAQELGVTPEALLNTWVQEKVEEAARK